MINVFNCSQVRWMAVVVVFAFSLVGCGSLPVGRYEAFRVATESVHDTTEDTFLRIEKRQRDFAVLTAPDALLTSQTFKPVIGGQSFDIRGQLETRDAAVETLVAYAKILEGLAGKDVSTDVDRATQNLAASLRRLSATPTGATAANGLASAVDTITRVVTSESRKDALKAVMRVAQPGIEALVRLFHEDRAKIATFSDLMKTSYLNHAQRARPPFGTWDRYRFDQEIAAVLEEFEQVQGALTAADVSLAKLPSAHRQLLESLDDRERPIDALRDMIREARQLQKFYRALPKT